MTIRSLGRAAGALVMAAGVALPASASADVYWYNHGTETIGRATSSGGSVVQDFLRGVDPHSLAVTNTHVYWATGSAIGRAAQDGSGATDSFLSLPPSTTVYGVAASDDHLYWTTGTTIGRVSLDGSNPRPDFLAADADALMVEGEHLYWADGLGGGRIGRTRLDGTAPAQPAFITGLSNPISLASDGTHLYGASDNAKTIGRARLDGGSPPSPTFLTDTTLAGPDSISSVAVADGYLFWGRKPGSSRTPSFVGRAKLDGSDKRPYFLPATDPFTITAINSQAISFPTLQGTTVTAGPVPLAATASSGLPIRYSSSTPTVCRVNGSQVVLSAVGMCRVTAEQPGDARYLAAAPVTRAFAVAEPPAPPPPARPLPVSGLRAAVSKGTIRLRWTPPVDATAQTSYRVRITHKNKILSRVTMTTTAKFTRLRAKRLYTACVVTARPDSEQFSASRCITRRIPRR